MPKSKVPPPDVLTLRLILRKAWEAADAVLAKYESSTTAESEDAATPQTPAQTPPPPPPEPPPPAPVELPNRFPATLVEAVAQSLSVGATPEFVKKVWEQAVARGGRDSKDVQIRSWSHHVSTCLAYERAAADKAKAVKGEEATAAKEDPPVWALKQALDAKLEKIADLRNKHAYQPAGGGWKWDHLEQPEVKEAYDTVRKLVAEVKVIRDKIAASVTT